MSRKRSHLEPKSRWKSKSAGAASHWTLLGEAPLLPGEDRAAYEQLRNQLCAVIKPVDIIDKILIADYVCSEWELLRLRRVKSSVVQARAMKALEQFLFFVLESRNQYSEIFVEQLTDILLINLPREQAAKAYMLAHKFAQNDPDAVDEVKNFLVGAGLSMSHVERLARVGKMIEMVQAYVRREPDTVALVDAHLAGAGESMWGFVVDAHIEKMNDIERIDRLIEHRREPPQRQPARDRAASGGPRRNAATERARNRGRRI